MRKTLQTFLLWFNIAQVTAWGLFIWPSVTIWKDSIAWLVFMSVWANFAGAVAGLTAALLSRQMTEENNS